MQFVWNVGMSDKSILLHVYATFAKPRYQASPIFYSLLCDQYNTWKQKNGAPLPLSCTKHKPENKKRERPGMRLTFAIKGTQSVFHAIVIYLRFCLALFHAKTVKKS